MKDTPYHSLASLFYLSSLSHVPELARARELDFFAVFCLALCCSPNIYFVLILSKVDKHREEVDGEGRNKERRCRVEKQGGRE